MQIVTVGNCLSWVTSAQKNDSTIKELFFSFLFNANTWRGLAGNNVLISIPGGALKSETLLHLKSAWKLYAIKFEWKHDNEEEKKAWNLHFILILHHHGSFEW